MGYKLVDITEGDIGDALFSEVLSIPLLLRGTSDTPLWDQRVSAGSLWNGQSLCEKLGLPTLSDSRGRATLMEGTIFGKFFPEILR